MLLGGVNFNEWCLRSIRRILVCMIQSMCGVLMCVCLCEVVTLNLNRMIQFSLE